MPVIRIADAHWGKVWHYLTETGPISRISMDHVYVISERQLKLLKKRKLPFELVDNPNGPVEKRKHG